MRVVSLIASSTEIVCALGLESSLVGRSHECDFPAPVARLPILTRPKFPVDGTSPEIDRQVKALLERALSVYEVDPGRLAEVRPDVIITQTQCEVCAVSLRDVEEAVCQLVESRPRIVSLEPNALADIWADIRRVADALDVSERGDELIARLETRMLSVSERIPADAKRPRVACVEWIEPLMAAGNWVPELVERAGGINLFGEAGKHSPWMTWPELVAKDPDIIVVLPCGFDIGRSRTDMPFLTRRPEWPNLSAVKSGRVFLADGNQYFNRPGPRVVESLEILAEMFHPQLFQFGHSPGGWQKL